MSARRTLSLFFLVAIGLAVYAAYAVVAPYRGYSGEVFVDIRRGAGTTEIARELNDAGVIRAEWPFLALRAVRPQAALKAGEYRFDGPLSMFEVYRKIAAGEVFYYTLTVPEGYNMFEIADAVAHIRVMSREEFLIEARKGGRVANLAPGAPSLEGFLYPDTYRITRHETAEELVGQMLKRFRDVFGQVQAKAGAKPAAVLETVTVASLIEKETAVAAERPVVASVYRNRLRIGMALQCDPTVIYALELLDRYDGSIHKEDLSLASPYNTYARPGLPPGPIANPGRASLEAALGPADTDYLYFVADARGGHVFSSTLEAHARAVANYLRANGRQSAKNNGRR